VAGTGDVAQRDLPAMVHDAAVVLVLLDDVDQQTLGVLQKGIDVPLLVDASDTCAASV
jgi:hypothetical protein